MSVATVAQLPLFGRNEGSRATVGTTEAARPEAPASGPEPEVPARPGTALAEAGAGSREFRREGGSLVRRLVLPDGSTAESRVELPAGTGLEPTAGNSSLASLWLRAYLFGARPRTFANPGRPPLRTVDLFCGAGGFALGVRQLAAEAGRSVVTELAVDVDEAALAVFAANVETGLAYPRSVASLVDFRVRGSSGDARFAYPPEILDKRVAAAVAGVDLVTAGPPCQGHSNLNNRSRRDDRRNRLFLTVPAFAVAAGAKAVAIENVPAVVHDRSSVVEAAKRLFEEAGYRVDAAVLTADQLGWPQTRQRYFMVARRRSRPVPLKELARGFRSEQRSVWWAIGDLEDSTAETDPMTTPSRISEENAARIEFLFENDEFDLPPSERPVCHREGTTYQAVYGRMNRELPAPTITTGFMSPGRGRFVHPTRPRTLTPREAARLQGFPDTHRFTLDSDNPPTRHQLAKWIGDAVPMPLGYVATLSAIGPDLPQPREVPRP